jgi:hypothetical protein
MCRLIEQYIYRCFLYDLACVHNDNSRTHLRNDTEIMGDQKDTHSFFFLDLFHKLQDLCLDRNVQCSRRLVRDQKLWITAHCHRDHNTLAHTTGKLMRIVFQYPRRIRDAYQF